jgi:hypothetical protein
MRMSGSRVLDLALGFACSVSSAVHGVRYPFVSFEGRVVIFNYMFSGGVGVLWVARVHT